MARKPSTKLLSTAAVTATLGILASVGWSAVTASPPVTDTAAGAAVSHSRGSVHLTAYTDNDGPTETVIVTGAVGDYGKAVSVYPNGTVDPEHDSELSLQLSHGTFRLDIASLDKAFVAAMLHDFPTDATTCSGSVDVTQQVPVVPGSGTGAYKTVGGAFTLTIALDEVDTVSSTQPCNGTGSFLGQAIVISGPGTVAF